MDEQQSQQAGQTGAAAGNAQNDMKKDVTGMVNKLEAALDEYMVAKAPFQLPMGLKEFIVKVLPYLIILSIILALPLILGALGLSAVFGSFATVGVHGYYGWGASSYYISLVVSAITIVLQAMAVPGLLKRAKSAWRLLFYVSLVSLIGSILVLNIIGGVIGAIIGWYFLFQIKALYKN